MVMRSADSAEFGGTAARGRRPNGSVRHAGMPEGMTPLVHPSDVMRSLKLTADPTGELEPDLKFAWQGLDRTRFILLNAAQEQEHPVTGVPQAHNRLMDP